jgi:hypothetical protein
MSPNSGLGHRSGGKRPAISVSICWRMREVVGGVGKVYIVKSEDAPGVYLEALKAPAICRKKHGVHFHTVQKHIQMSLYVYTCRLEAHRRCHSHSGLGLGFVGTACRLHVVSVGFSVKCA